MNKYLRSCFGVMFLLMLLISCQIKNGLMNDLNITIEKHFSAIKSRNIEDLLETVNKEKITLILPNGKYSESLSDYKKVNTDWFADKDWNIEYEIVDKIFNKGTGVVLTKITYFDKDENGENYSFQYYLTLIFELRKNDWELVFDQNTIIK